MADLYWLVSFVEAACEASGGQVAAEANVTAQRWKEVGRRYSLRQLATAAFVLSLLLTQSQALTLLS